MAISSIFGVVTLKDDQGSAANLLMIFIDIPTKNDASLMQYPAIVREKKEPRMKNINIVNVSVPRSGTAIRLAIMVMEETRLE